MKKFLRFAILPICALALVGCSSDKDIKKAEALDYSKDVFSAETVLKKYESVSYKRTVTLDIEEAKVVKNKDKTIDEEKTNHNKAVLAELETLYKVSEVDQKEVNLDVTNIDQFFFGEAFVNEFEKDYKADNITPAYTKLKKGGLRVSTTYSKAFDDNQLSVLLGSKEGGMAVKSIVTSDKQGCIISTSGTYSAAIDVDGDDNADVQYAFSVEVTFNWKAKTE